MIVNSLLKNGAIFSKCSRYRYALWRIWDPDGSSIMFIGLNPSLADECHDDQSIRRITSFAKEWGYGKILVLNLFARITPYPKQLFVDHDPVGPKNSYYLKHFGGLCDEVVFCWGAFDTRGRAHRVKRMFTKAKCIQLNKDGSPRHPLYVSSKEQLQWFK